MRTPMIAAALLAAITMSGCVSQYNGGVDDLRKMDNGDVLLGVGAGNKNARIVAEERSLLTKHEWELVDAHKIEIGAREAVLWAAWGPWLDLYEGASEWGRYRHYEYANYGVDVHDGVIRGWDKFSRHYY